MSLSELIILAVGASVGAAVLFLIGSLFIVPEAFERKGGE